MANDNTKQIKTDGKSKSVKGLKKLEPLSETITKKDINKELFEAVEKKNFSIVKKLLKNGASFCLDEKENVISYSNVLSKYNKTEMDKLVSVIKQVKKDEILMDIFCLPAKRSFTIVGILDNFVNSIRENDFNEFSKSIKNGTLFDCDVANHTILEFDTKSGITEYGNCTFIDGSKLDTEGNKITPLMLCVREGRMEMFNELIKKNPDLLFKDKYENSALSIAKRLGREEMIEILENELQENLLSAIKNKNFEQIKKLFEAGANLKQEHKQFLCEVMKTYSPEEDAKFEALCHENALNHRRRKN